MHYIFCFRALNQYFHVQVLFTNNFSFIIIIFVVIVFIVITDVFSGVLVLQLLVG